MPRFLPIFLIAVALASCTPGDDLGAGQAVNTIGEPHISDEMRRQQAEKRAYTAPIGQQMTWRNPDTGNSGTVTPVRDSYDAAGAYCRELKWTSVVGGQQKQNTGKACQQPDGGWQKMS